MFDRIMILPTSAPPQNPAPAAAIFPTTPLGGARPAPVPSPGMAPPPQSGTLIDADDNDDVPLQSPVAMPRVFTPGQPTDDPSQTGAPRQFLPPGGVARPQQIGPDGTVQQAPAPVVTTPGNPFGLPPGASDRPGFIAQPPPQPQPPPRQGPED
jgi:hypothetical protein